MGRGERRRGAGDDRAAVCDGRRRRATRLGRFPRPHGVAAGAAAAPRIDGPHAMNKTALAGMHGLKKRLRLLHRLARLPVTAAQESTPSPTVVSAFDGTS